MNRPEEDRIPMSHKELEAIELVMCYDAILRGQSTQDAMKHRAKLSGKRTWNKFRCGCALIGKAADEMYGTIPSKTLKHMADLCHNFVPVLKPRNIGTGNYIYITCEDLQTLINTCMANECAICMKEGEDERRCPLRWAMAHNAPGEAKCRTPECPYKGIATSCEYGKYGEV